MIRERYHPRLDEEYSAFLKQQREEQVKKK